MSALDIITPRVGKVTHIDVPIGLVAGITNGQPAVVGVTNEVDIAHAWIADRHPDRGIALPGEMHEQAAMMVAHWIERGEIA